MKEESIHSSPRENLSGSGGEQTGKKMPCPAGCQFHSQYMDGLAPLGSVCECFQLAPHFLQWHLWPQALRITLAEVWGVLFFLPLFSFITLI